MRRLLLSWVLGGRRSLCSSAGKPRHVLPRRRALSGTVSPPPVGLPIDQPSTGKPWALLFAGALYAFGLFGWFSREEDVKVPNVVKTCFSKAKQAISDGEYQEAEFQYHRALELLTLSPYSTSKTFLKARGLANKKLASLHLKMDLREEALRNYSESMKLMLARGESTLSRGIVETSLKVAGIYIDLKKYDLARTGLDWCLETAKNKAKERPSPQNLELLGMCQHAMGQFFLTKGNFDTAHQWFSLSLSTARKAYAKDNLQVAVLCSDVAAAMEGLSEYDKAEELILEAVSISECCTDVSSEHMARLFMNLGAVKSNRGQTMEAVDAYNVAKEHASRLPSNELLAEIENRIRDLGARLPR